MKKMFRGYYRPTNEELSDLWRDCIFSVDANVLLNLYRYSADTRDELLSILSEFKDRLWISHQAAFEFHKNRLKVIVEQQDAYENIETILNESKNKLISQTNEYKRHPFINIESLIKKIDLTFKKSIKEIRNQKAKHPSLIEKDPILEKISCIFDKNTGTAFSAEQLNAIYKSGAQRYSNCTPPGYKDSNKDGNNQFGDLILWKQLIDQSKELKKNFIFITDDTKEDWWTRLKGKTIGPRPELISEFLSETGNSFYMYQTDQFIEISKKTLNQKISSNTLSEIREVSAKRILEQFLIETSAQEEYTRNRKSDLVASYNKNLEEKLALESKLESIDQSDLNTLNESTQLTNESELRSSILERIGNINLEISKISQEIKAISSLDSRPTLARLALKSPRDYANAELLRRLYSSYFNT